MKAGNINVPAVFITAMDADGDDNGTTTLSIGSEPVKEEENKFTQADIDKIVADRLGRQKQKFDEQLKTLQDEFSKSSASTAEKEQYVRKIKELEVKHLDTEEQYKTRISDLEKTFSQKENQLSRERDSIKDTFYNYRIQTELHTAAEIAEAFFPNQVITLMKDKTTIKDVLDEKGNRTGLQQVVVRVEKQKEDGSVYEIEASPMDAVKAMREQPQLYGNLFRSKSKDGIGLLPGENSQKKTTDLVLDKGYDAYVKSVKDNPEKLGIKE